MVDPTYKLAFASVMIEPCSYSDAVLKYAGPRTVSMGERIILTEHQPKRYEDGEYSNLMKSSSGGDAGVGRFEVGKKNAIMLHDIAIGKIFGVDFEKLKAICRAETTVAKIHGHVAVLPPLHLFYSSNQRLMTHVV